MKIDEVRHDLHVALRLHIAAHYAERSDRPPVFHKESGNDRVISPLTRHQAVDVFGIDGSVEMLSVAFQKSLEQGEHILFVNQRMQELELAEKIDVDPKTLAGTLNNWNKYVADKKDPDFGRTTGMDKDLSQAPYYAIKIAPGIHHTMGGVHIDTSAEVIDTEGNTIPGLFAAGEVVGGVHGGNRIGGNAVADIVVFGKIASDSAVQWCDEH